MSKLNVTSGKNDLRFKSQSCTLSANLYTPADFDASRSYPTVVFSPPFNQVKEQTGAVYGRNFAEHGYVTLVFDHLGYGDSEGKVRNYENAAVKMESIRDAVSFLRTLPFVDRERLYGLGVCASGGYMALVAVTDKRLKCNSIRFWNAWQQVDVLRCYGPRYVCCCCGCSQRGSTEGV